MQQQLNISLFCVLFLFSFKDRVVIEPHPAPKKYENFELSGMIYCKICHWNWGVMGVHKKVPLPKCNIAKLVVVNPYNSREKYSRWKEVPFDVQPMLPSDLSNIDKDEDTF